jgi:ATP-dependent RNA helicase MSS116
LLHAPQAKTGTGKTMAFLAPTVDSLIRGPARVAGQISCLIISPTRELASQIAVEAQGILPQGFKCVTVYGQTNVKADVRNLAGGCDILVGTPGRLNDLIANFGLSPKLAGVRHFILDEGDTLLDAGFKPEIVKICRGLPNRQTHPRQSLLFSATVPASLKDVVSVALLPSYKHLSAIRPEDENTHERVPQDTLVVPWSQIYGAALAKLAEEIALHPDNYKIMVFLPTARGTAILYEAAQQLTLGNTWEIQSRMSQPARERSSAAFKVASSGILFSSDVTARGMDFKGVGYVLQVGVPMNPEVRSVLRTRTPPEHQTDLFVCAVPPDPAIRPPARPDGPCRRRGPWFAHPDRGRAAVPLQAPDAQAPAQAVADPGPAR